MGVFWVSLNKKWGLYDFARNAPLGELQWDKEGGRFQDGKAWVLRDGKYGMIDTTGKVVLEPVWEGSKKGIPPDRAGNFVKAVKDGKTAWWHVSGAASLPDGDEAASVKFYRGYFQLKIANGKLIRDEKNFSSQEPSRMVILQDRNAGLADMDGKLLGEVRGNFINATPSPDYFQVELYGPQYGLIDATGMEVEPVSRVESIPLDTLQIDNPESLPDGEIIAAFRGTSDTTTPDALFIKTAKGLVKVPWKAPAASPKEAPSTVTVKAHKKDGKWGYIRLIEAK